METTTKKYIDQKNSELFESIGAFFAFNNQQFEEGYEKAKIEKPVKYVHAGYGLYCPQNKVKELIRGLKAIKEQWMKDRKEKENCKLIFVGIDNWNRPVWKVPHKREYYGSVNELFDEGATEAEVLKKVDIFDLCYFGYYFGCEPMGTDVPDRYIL